MLVRGMSRRRPHRYPASAALIALSAAVALGCGGGSDDEPAGGAAREDAEQLQPAEVGDPPTVPPAPVEGVDARPPRPTVIASGQTARGDPFELVLYGTSRGPCISTLYPARRSFEGGGRCGEGILLPLSAPIQSVGSSSTDQNVVEVDGFVGPDVDSVQLSFELEGETKTLDAVTEQLAPELIRKAGGEEPLGVFIAFLPGDGVSEADVTATAYDSDGDPLGTATWFDPDRAAPMP